LEALPIIAIVGILLYKLNRRKETYMTDAAFLFGRFLALADDLHASYCAVVRKNNLPPQLLGNQHYAMASAHPYRTLDVLGQRLRIYQAWARTAIPANGEAGKSVRIAKWALGRLADCSSQLHGQVPRQFTQTERAEMLLGYLSREKKAPSMETDSGELETKTEGRHEPV
jgi:hypothetical protein